MLLDVHQLLDLAQPLVSSDLVPEPRWRRLRDIPNLLPPAIVVGTLECRLDREAQVDFQICLTTPSGGRDVVRDWLDHLSPASLPADEAWQRSQRFLAAWADPASPLFDSVPAVWFEFDVDDGAAPPFPFGFFTLTPPWVRERRPPLTAMIKTVRVGLDLLAGGRLDAATADSTLRCLLAFPAYAALLHVAVRPRSDGDVVRLIFKMPWRRAAEYLRSVQWPGSTDDLEALLQRYGNHGQINSFQLDVGAQLGPRLGIEFYYPSSPRRDPRWIDLFAKLVADGACTAPLAAAAQAWPAAEDDEHPDIQRELLVKLVYEVGQPLRAKAYLPFGALSDGVSGETPASTPRACAR